MPSISRLGDATSPHEGWSGGLITSGSPDVIIEGMPASTIGDAGTPHVKPDNPPHGVVISGGSGSILVNGKPLSRIGDPASCGSTVSSGSMSVIGG